MKQILQRLFPIGRLSLLFGVHNVFWHPVTVYRAWRSLYGKPTWREVVCIIVHDWGYWSCPNIDGPEGELHPVGGARLVGWLLGPEYRTLVLFHSRSYVRRWNDYLARENPDAAPAVPSKLCWADKLSILYDPPWFYLLRARITGELKEYRANAAKSGFCPSWEPDTVWLGRLQAHHLMAHAREASQL